MLRADLRPLPLTSKAVETLLVLVRHPGQLLDKDTLMRAVWPNVVVEENNLNQSISALRRVLGDSRDEPRFIVTVPGRGYRFIANVRIATDSPNAAHPLPVEPIADVRAPRASRWPWRWLGAGAALLLIIAVLAAFLIRSGRGPDASQSVAVPTSTDPPGAIGLRLAVLPFANLSPDPANAFFADGLHEEILSTLSVRLPGVAVISRTTMLTYRPNPQPLREVARALSATHVLEGTVRREGEHVRLTLQLVDAGTDRYLWSHTYDQMLSSVMRLQVDVAAEVAEQLSVRLAGTTERTHSVTGDAAAYDFYLRALLALRDLNGLSPTSDYQAIERLLTDAIARDPEFALAYAQRARLHTLRFISSIDTSPSTYRSISADLDAARRLAPQDPIVLAASAYFLLADGEIPRSLEVIQAAEAAGLQDPEWLIPKTRILLSLQRVDEAVRVHERMLSLDPANPLVLDFTAAHLVFARKPQAALRVVKMGAAYLPNFANYWDGYLQFATRGDVSAWRKALTPLLARASAPAIIQDPVLVTLHFQLLRYERRYAEILELLNRVPLSSLRCTGEDSQTFDSVGERPVAEYRGWAHLLLNDRAHAKEQGNTVLAFVARQPRTKWNPFFLELLAAEAYTFTGERDAALAAARSSLALMPRSKNAVAWVGTAFVAARVFGWNGSKDEAAGLLEELVTSAPGLQPGFIARDPLFTVPLADNARFQALAQRLEKEMRASAL